MTLAYQASLPILSGAGAASECVEGFAAPEVGLGPLTACLERRLLPGGAWVDHLPGWVTGADELFERLVHAIPWHAEERPMYDDVVDRAPPALPVRRRRRPARPRPGRGARCPQRALRRRARRAVRDGGLLLLPRRARLGGLARRQHRARPQRRTPWSRSSPSAPRDGSRCARSAGAPRRRTPSGTATCVVMGGSCQRTWEHAFLKTARPAGPRIWVQLRPRNVF